MNSAEALLTTLRKRLDKPISQELKRRIIETLVESVRADTVERWGVQQTQITVTYRFAQPNEAAAAVLPLEHHLTNRTRLPEKLDTVGDHIRRRRLTLKLLQRQVAQQLGVNNKRAIYIKHNLRMVQEVCEESDWTLSQIEAREVRIAAWAKVRWSDV